MLGPAARYLVVTLGFAIIIFCSVGQLAAKKSAEVSTETGQKLEQLLRYKEHQTHLPNKKLFTEWSETEGDTTYYYKDYTVNAKRENATIFSLVRNNELYMMLATIRNFEDRFNKNYHYDWVFANDEAFTDDFVKQVKNICSGTAIFVHLPKNMWDYPEFIDQDKAGQTRDMMRRKRIKYGGSESYRHMCRFFSGLFFNLDVMKHYKWFWRVEPDVEFRCSINYDPFKVMREENKAYGFTLAPLELHTTVATLWDTVKEYMQTYPERIAEDNNFDFLTDDGGKSFNMCHFWSNFEIADMDWFRSDSYSHFFDYLDHKGGIYYERWGDAPIHSIAVSILLPHNKLKYFSNTGYMHTPNLQCDGSPSMLIENECLCSNEDDTCWGDSSCIPKIFDIHNDWERPSYAPTRIYLPIHDERLRELELLRIDLKKQGKTSDEIDSILDAEMARQEGEQNAEEQVE